jgi:integrase
MKKPNAHFTRNTISRWLESAKERETLWHPRQPGLHLFKTKYGASWRIRRKGAGRRVTQTLGKFPAMGPREAVEQALLGPQKVEPTPQPREGETLASYLEGAFSLYQARRRAGRHTLAILRSNFAALLDRRLESLTRADMLAWQHQREEAGIAHVTLQRAYGALKTLLRDAVRKGALAENPLATVSLEKGRGGRKTADRRTLTPEELQGLRKGLDSLGEYHWFRVFTLIALYTGLRPGDIYSLTWEELNIPFKRLVKIPEKTKDHPNPAQVVMDLPGPLLRVLNPWWELYGNPETGGVFISPLTGKRYDRKAHLSHWEKVKKAGDLPEGLKFYSLRHHFISTLITQGVPLMTVARLAGHKSGHMIAHFYYHLCPSTSRAHMTQYAESLESLDVYAVG